MEQEIINIINANAQIVAKVGTRIYHIHIDSANVYPAIAFFIDVTPLGVCVGGTSFTGQVTLMVETRSMRELTDLRKLLIDTFLADGRFRFLSATPDMESTSKKYYGEIDFKIIRIDEL